MLKLLPAPEAARARPRVSVAVVVDTSGSMREPAPGTTPDLVATAPVTVDGKTYNATYRGTSKLDLTVDAASRLVQSELLQPDDAVSLIHFDDDSDVLATATIGEGRERLLEAVERLREFSGGTQMAPGLRNAESELRCAGRRHPNRSAAHRRPRHRRGGVPSGSSRARRASARGSSPSASARSTTRISWPSWPTPRRGSHTTSAT